MSDDGYVDTGDMVELEDGRYYFRGRIGRRHQCRRPQGLSRGGGIGAERRSSGAHVAGARAPQSHHRRGGGCRRGAGRSCEPAASDTPDLVKNDLLEACRRTLAAHKVPAMLRFVPSLEFTAAGKLVRP